MDASKQLWRGVGRYQAGVVLAILLVASLATGLSFLAYRQTGPTNHAQSGSSSNSSSNRGWVAGVRNLLHDPLAFFSQRSPGARSSKDLIQSKHRMVKLARHGAKPPRERVLANVRYPSPIPDYLNDLIAPVQTALFEPGTIPAFAVPTGPVTPGVPPSIVPVSVPGGGTPGGGPPGGGTVVPEPSTWSTLILGMALIGIGLRSKRRGLAKDATRSGFRARN